MLPTLALLAGGWAASDPKGLILWLGAVALALLGARNRGLGLTGPILFVAVALASGWWLAHTDERRSHAAETAWWWPSAERIEGSFDAELLAAPERDIDGGRMLKVRLFRPQSRGLSGPGLAFRLRVAASPPEPTARVDALRAGDRLRVWARIVGVGEGQPGADDRRWALRIKGLSGHGFVKSARLVELLEQGRNGPRRLLDELKAEARLRLDRSLGVEHPSQGLVRALVLGDRGGLTPGDLWALRRAGLTHLVSISGLHVTLLFSMALLFVGRRLPSRVDALALALTALVVFSIFVGPLAAVLRAVAGAAVLLIGRRLGRDGDALNSLAWIGAAIFATWPPVLHDAGFQLSFAATAAILGLGEPIASRLPGPRALRHPVAISTAAYVATAPICAVWFQSIAPVGLLANLLAVPMCAICLATGYMTLLLEPLPWLGRIAATTCGLSGQAIIDWAEFVSAWPRGAQRVGAPGHWVITAVLTLVLWCCVSRPQHRMSRRWLASALALALLAVQVGPVPRIGEGHPELVVLDVGQGQSVALLGPWGGLVLVDAGGSANARFDPGERIVAPEIAAWNRGRIDTLVISHAHIDHLGGATALVKELEVGELWLPPGSAADMRLSDLAAHARAKGAAVVAARSGLRERRVAMPLRVLAPAPPTSERRWGANDGSVVLLAGTRPYRVLIPGDVEAAAERALVESGRALAAEVLVVPHHGSRSSSSASLLSRVRPEWALISAGRWNRFGHPHAEVLTRLEAVGAQVRRTDLEGHLHLRGDGRGWRGTSAGSEQLQRHWNERDDEQQQQH